MHGRCTIDKQGIDMLSVGKGGQVRQRCNRRKDNPGDSAHTILMDNGSSSGSTVIELGMLMICTGVQESLLVLAEKGRFCCLPCVETRQ